MPIYEYECRQCHSRFERLENLSQDPLKTCPSCGAAVHRLVSKTGGFVIQRTSPKQHHQEDTHCGNTSPCCGRETRCEERPCD